MKILAIDTTSKICSVAILENEIVIDEINLDNGLTHSENLMPLVDELLKRNNLKLSDFELISCCTGPGSFTGIRIGVASIKAMAEVNNLKIANVTSLETLAKIDNSNKVKVSLIDARNNQVYCGIFDKNYEKLEDFMACDISNVIEILKKYDNMIFIGDGAIMHKNLILENIPNAEFSKDNNQKASLGGMIAYKNYLKGKLYTADTILPTYLRKSQAERLKVQISKMTLEDFEKIKDILQTEFDDFWNADILKSELESDNKKYFVAKKNEEILGFAGILQNGDELEIMNIVTKKSNRKKGIGKLLLEKIIKDAENNNFKEIFLEVNEENDIAIKLYQNAGFAKIGERKNYYGEKNAILMSKKVNNL